MSSKTLVESEADVLVADGWGLVRDLEAGRHDDVRSKYQAWYSRALPFLRTLAPDRASEFEKLYQRTDKGSLSYVNFAIQDYLLDLKPSYSSPEDWALVRLRQQAAIVGSVRLRLDSALADLRGLVEADLLGSETAAARELANAGHLRAAGCLAGVVIERELSTLAAARGVVPKKTDPTIAEWNDALKAGGVFDQPPWRRVQRLGDIRNLCCHAKDREPTRDEVEDLIRGAEWLGAEWSG